MSTNGRKKAPKYCLHKPSGRAYLRVRGRVVYCGEHGTAESLKEYGRLIADLAANPSAPAKLSVAAGAIFVVELADAYYQHCEGYYQKNGQPSGWLRHIHLMLSTHLVPLYGETLAAEFGPKAFKAIRQTLIDAGHSRRYINKLMPIVTRCFKWGAAEEIVTAGIFHALRTVDGLKKGRTTAPERPPVLPVDDATVDATLPFLPPIVADMVRFQRLTGCRPGEVCQLRPGDIDRTADVWVFRPESHKTEHHDRERIIFIGPKAQAVILPYLLREATANCFSPAEGEAKRREALHEVRKTPPGYGNRPGTNRKRRPKRMPADCYNKDSYARAIRRGVDKANQRYANKPKNCRSTIRPWSPIGHRTDCGTRGQRKSAGNSAWRPRKSFWATPRPTFRKSTRNATLPRPVTL